MLTAIVGNNYKNVTSEWIQNATPNSHRVKDRNYFETENGKRYYVDGKNVVLDYSKKEREIAEWLENTFGGEIYMLPRINKPDGIKTADYLFRGEKWDLKTVQGCKAQTLYHAIYKNGNQSHNFIFEILNPSLSLFNSSKQVDKIYQRTDIPFFDKCIIKKGENFVIFKRIKKEYDRTVRSARPHSLQNNIHCFNEYVNIKSKNSFFLFF